MTGDETGDAMNRILTNRGSRLNTVKLLLGIMLSAWCGTAAAQQPSQAQIGAIKQSCRSDYQSYCSGVPTGGSAALQCLQGHMASLSAGCQSAVGAVAGGGSKQTLQPAPSGAAAAAPPAAMSPREQAGLMRRACGGDFRTFCQGVRPGGGRALGCLAQNQAQLSPSCRGALAQAQGQR